MAPSALSTTPAAMRTSASGSAFNTINQAQVELIDDVVDVGGQDRVVFGDPGALAAQGPIAPSAKSFGVGVEFVFPALPFDGNGAGRRHSGDWRRQVAQMGADRLSLVERLTVAVKHSTTGAINLLRGKRVNPGKGAVMALLRVVGRALRGPRIGARDLGAGRGLVAAAFDAVPLLERGACCVARLLTNGLARGLAPIRLRLLRLPLRCNVNRGQMTHHLFSVELAGLVAERVEFRVLHETVAEVGWSIGSDDAA